MKTIFAAITFAISIILYIFGAHVVSKQYSPQILIAGGLFSIASALFLQ